MELIPVIVVNGVEMRGEEIFTSSIELSAKLPGSSQRWFQRRKSWAPSKMGA